MSGGVDSSVAALLLHREGRSLIGISLQMFDHAAGETRRFGRCCSPRDFLDARMVAEKVGFPFYVLNMESEFASAVMDDFVREYAAGRTPVPCAHCNSEVKFGDLLRRARDLGCDGVATGHYARRSTDPRSGRPRLLRARDREKDQSYFLFGLTDAQLDQSLFPIGELTKDSVRSLANDAGLGVATKPESMDICFLSGKGYPDFVRQRFEQAEIPGGEIVDRRGEVLGRHDGVHRFTVGQRRGLGLAGPRPWYVLEIDARTRTVVVGSEEEQYRSQLRVPRPNWIGDDPPRRSREAMVQIRHRHPGAEATLEPDSDGSVRVRFRRPQRAITPGQAAVFYRDEQVLGGGFISGEN